jgi:hypothetical protein
MFAGPNPIICGFSNFAGVRFPKESRTTTDTFGDFKCDGFERESGVYSIEMTHWHLGAAFTSCALGDSVYLGTLALSAAGTAGSEHAVTVEGIA